MALYASRARQVRSAISSILKGYYCPGGTLTVMNLCGQGYYSTYGASTCTQCPAGFYCPTASQQPIACAPFTYAVAGSLACSPCPVGSVCNHGVITTCTAGQFCANTANTVAVPCPAGSFCPYPYATSLDSTNLCPLGTYSAEGAVACTICPLGSACPAPSLGAQACPGGYYQDQAGQTSCKVCPKGYYCNVAVSPSPIRCAVG